MMAPDRPAEARSMDHGRESEGFGIDDTTTSIRLDVTPRRISTEYGLSRAVKIRSINRRPPVNRVTKGRPGGTYLYWIRSRCTRARVAAETSARSLSTLETVANDTPAASATVCKVGRWALVTGPFLFGGPQLPWNRSVPGPSRRATRNISMLNL